MCQIAAGIHGTSSAPPAAPSARGENAPGNPPSIAPSGGGIRGSRGRDVSIERRRGHAEAMSDLGHTDIGIGEHGRRDGNHAYATLAYKAAFF